MPQLVAAVLIGAGVAAGVKWMMRELMRTAAATRLSHEELRRRESPARSPRDLGKLEFDAKSGVYRPARKRA